MALDKKIYELDRLLTARAAWKEQGLRCVFTNGCFDILHEGHVRYLEEARSLGDILIVALNNDQSVRHLKGPTRPINAESSRSIVLAALESVSAVVLFGTDTPLEVIQALTPEVLVKGGDWDVQNIVGADWVLSHGGEVYALPYHKGFSTSLIEQKMKTS